MGIRIAMYFFNYINRNPVEAGLAGRADEWEYEGVCHFIKGETSILDIPPWIQAAYQAFIRGCWQN
jgi:hypothetical protein